jgi:hypothetical protein
MDKGRQKNNRNSQVSVRKSKGYAYTDADWKIILKWILRKLDGSVETELI